MAESMDTGTDTERQPPYFSDTRVFWDVVDFPLPLDGDLDRFCLNVNVAISNERFVGEVEFYAYGDELSNQDRMEIRRAGIWLKQEGAEKRERLNRMLLDVLEYAHYNRDPADANFLIAMKDIPEIDTKLFSIMQALRQKGYEVWFVVPDDCPSSQVPDFDTATLVWRCSILREGGYPIYEPSESDSDDEGSALAAKKRQNEEGSSQGAEKLQKITDDDGAQ
ncbi:unnamed protein product [Microthlaspi erraticum]|uniref:NYN domain-containing protein n=1 Tax=Microthlaspi erraticum TaxID=1685480 RepID=A0A6D2KV02_9BRAS|nr:unnamed protein product [Microthlaspi erraticum]